MIIVVLCEFGGERLLGKAREIADSQGYSVLAVCSNEKRNDANRLIALGADEVELYNVKAVSDWIVVLSDTLNRKGTSLRTILLPSNIFGNLIYGGVCVKASERIGPTLDYVDSINDSSASKELLSSSAALSTKVSDEEKTTMFSVKLTSVTEPFEDSGRYGKVSTSTQSVQGASIETPSVEGFGPSYLDSSSRLTVVFGIEKSTALEQDLCKKIAERYGGLALSEDEARGRVIYGPCIAVQIVSAIREIPEIDGTLISFNSEEAPISKVASIAVINSNIDQILEKLLAS